MQLTTTALLSRAVGKPVENVRCLCAEQLVKMRGYPPKDRTQMLSTDGQCWLVAGPAVWNLEPGTWIWTLGH